MNAAQRKQLLRERFKARPKGVTVPVGGGMASGGKQKPNPPRVRYVVLPKPTGRGFVSCGPLQAVTPPLWVTKPDQTSVRDISIKRRQGVSALMKIADRWATPTYREETKRLDLHLACR